MTSTLINMPDNLQIKLQLPGIEITSTGHHCGGELFKHIARLCIEPENVLQGSPR